MQKQSKKKQQSTTPMEDGDQQQRSKSESTSNGTKSKSTSSSQKNDSNQQTLEKLLEQYFELYSEIQSLRQISSNHMKEGLLLMSKARYSGRGSSITESEYDMNMQATVLLDFDSEHNSFSIEGLDKQGIENKNNITLSPKPKENESSTTEMKLTTKSKDPIFWFGGFPSAHIRNAQIQFKKALKILVDVANKQHEMNAVQDKYFQLKGEPIKQNE